MDLETVGFDLNMQRTLSLGRLEKLVEETKPEGIPDRDARIMGMGLKVGHGAGFADGITAAVHLIREKLKDAETERTEEQP
jgi:hypothetical protein